MILIGSKAANYHFPYIWNKPMDYDIICTMDEFTDFVKRNRVPAFPKAKNRFIGKWKNKMVDFEIGFEGNSAWDLCQCLDDISIFDLEYIDGEYFYIPNMDILYTIKYSHRFLKNSPHFLKTMNDVMLMSKHLGCRLYDPTPGWLKKRENETYKKKYPNLNQSKKDFFTTEGVVYKYDHDTIHEAVAQLDKPAYEYYKDDNREVFCSKKKFFEECNEMIRLFGVLEESYVLALERSQIPFPGRLTPKQSFDIALMKVCTSITSGWFREYAYNHYYEVQKLYSDSYVLDFEEALSKGLVKPYKG